MPKRLSLLILSGLLTLGAAACQGQSPEPLKVFCWSLTPQVQAVIRGLERGLGRTLPVVEAGGDYHQGEILVRQLATDNLKLLIVLGTPALSLTAPRIKKNPVVFAMVADPYHSGAAYDKNRPHDHQENITGLASPPPLEEAIRQSLKLFPAKRHWGLLYDPLEGPSVELKQNFAGLAQAAGLTLSVVPVSPESGPAAALAALAARQVQVVFIPPDHCSQSYALPLLALGRERRLVVVNGNPRLSGPGAVLRVTLDYQALGEQAAALAQRILAGEKPAAIPITQASPFKLEVDEALLDAWAGYPPGR